MAEATSMRDTSFFTMTDSRLRAIVLSTRARDL
jgi:hypothetical protein